MSDTNCPTIFDSNVIFNSETTLNSTLNVSGATTLANTTASTLNVTGATTLANTTAGSLNVSGTTTLANTTSNTLNVSGATTLVSTLNVSGSTTLADTTASTLNVTGATTLANTTLSSLNVDNVGTLTHYKTLLYNSTTKQVRWTNTTSTSSSDALTINTTGVPTLTTDNTGKYYIKTIGSTQQLRFRIKTGTSAYQDLLIGTYDTVEPTIVLPEGTSVIKTVNSTFNDTINVTDAGITETITFGTTSYPYNTDISTTFGTIRANLIDSTSNSQTSIDMLTINTYTINYIATDNSGNTREVSRTLTISIDTNFYHNYYKLDSSLNYTTNDGDTSRTYNYDLINSNYVGYTVAINSLGNYLAYSKNNSNKIVIKKQISNAWSIYGNYITTTNITTIVNIQLDRSGNKLIFNDIPSTGNSKLYIYTNNGTDFNNLLQTIPLSYAISQSINNHNSISISGDGNIILVSESSGYICIYKLNQTSNQYVKKQTLGAGIDNYGFSTSIDNSGNKLIIGEPLHNSSNGKVYLYNFSNNNYSIIPTPTPTEFTSDTIGITSGYNQIGYDVSISDTGRFAFSAPFANINNKTNSGCVFIYENDNTHLTTIHGYEDYMGFGTKIELSKNGKVITITARDSYNNDLNTSTGFIKMYYEYQEKNANTSADSVWLEIDHKNLYSDTSDVDIKFGFSSALGYSGTKLLVGSPNYDFDTYTSVGNINLYEYTETDAKIYNSWDLYLADKNTAEYGLKINDLENIQFYITEVKNNPHTVSGNTNYIFNIKNGDGIFDNSAGQGYIKKFNRLEQDTVYQYIIKSPNFKEYLSGNINGDINTHPPSNQEHGIVLKIPITETGQYVIYNSFIWPYIPNQTQYRPVGLSIFTGTDSIVSQIGTTFQFYSGDITNIDDSYKNFIKYYSGDNGPATNYDTINGLELGNLGIGESIYFVITNEGDWGYEHSILRFQIAKRPTTNLPTEKEGFKHILTISENQPICNPWNGTAIDELAPTVYNPLVTYSKYGGRDLEIKLKIILNPVTYIPSNLINNGTIYVYHFAGWRLDEVFNFYLKNEDNNTSGTVFSKGEFNIGGWVKGDNIKCFKLSNNSSQWTFTNETENSSITNNTNFGYREDYNFGLSIASDNNNENIKYLKTYATGGINSTSIIREIQVYVKKAGIMAIVKGSAVLRLSISDTYVDEGVDLYEWRDNNNDYVSISVEDGVTFQISETFFEGETSNGDFFEGGDPPTELGTYTQTYAFQYDGNEYEAQRTIIIIPPTDPTDPTDPSATWTKTGQDLYSNPSGYGDLFGISASISNDGTIIAIAGEKTHTANGVRTGIVKIYSLYTDSNNFNNWNLIGDINGEFAEDKTSSVSLSNDGYTVAIGSKENDGNGDRSGSTRVFTFNGSSWVQKGQDLDGENIHDESGYAVSLSGDGSIVAIGALFNDGTVNNGGHVRVYEYNSPIWVTKGPDIDAITSDDHNGFSVSLSDDGLTVAVGAPFNSNSGQYAGLARVFTWNGSTWSQKGQNLLGTAASDEFGRSVSLSDDGNRLAVSAPGSWVSQPGKVMVYDYDWTGSVWNQIVLLHGEYNYQQLGKTSVSLSGNGHVLCAGAPNSDAGTGKARLFYYTNGTFNSIANITGDNYNEGEGNYVALSKDGLTLLTTAIQWGSYTGRARVYKSS